MVEANGDGAIRHVRLPAGWEGLSFKLREDTRIFVAEVPKACFSSAAFGAAGAKPQVEGVSEGDEIVTLNGETPARVAERITASGDAWNACSSAEPAHAVGSKGKFDSPPCAACDFVRRRRALGLDVALQMWLRAVKRDIQITLGVKPGGGASAGAEPGGDPQAESQSSQTPACSSREAKSVVQIKDSSTTSSLGELKSLDDLSSERSKAQLKARAGRLKDGKGKGKKAKGKGAGKKPRPSGPDLPRTRVSTAPVTGEVVEWKGKYGWIMPARPLDHAAISKHKGRLYIHENDLVHASKLEAGMTCRFQVFSDASGLGAEECVVLTDPNDKDSWEGQEWEAGSQEEWDDDDWEDGDWEDEP